jgi:hypothetical protein
MKDIQGSAITHNALLMVKDDMEEFALCSQPLSIQALGVPPATPLSWKTLAATM